MEARLSFVNLGVADLERATPFYADVLGLPPVSRSRMWPLTGGEL